MITLKIGYGPNTEYSLILVVVERSGRKEQINLSMESSKDLFELVTPVRVRMRSRIPVRSPGGGSSPFGRASSSKSPEVRCPQRLVQNLRSPCSSIILVPGMKEEEEREDIMDDTKEKPDEEKCVQENIDWQKKEERI